MKNKYKVKGTTLHLTDLRATLHIEGLASLITITFDKELLEMYAEDYIKEHFEISEDGWVRKAEEDGKETSL
ncbi:hypothetical protein U1280_11305 [Enterococcus cecorum]|uniref:hypothetical protein n=1 Tax=Enterococcus cecorum TaxID=44008 RepID=UPI002ACA15CB|nr:hypothetical protein [Enterococcus cecorum]MDZ5583224.1 hypothetical protein [Enterococcus cecorum]